MIKCNYTITDTSIATVSGSTVTTKEGALNLVNQLENQCYNSISTSMTLDVNTVSQAVSWMTDIYKIFGDEFTLDMPITDSVTLVQLPLALLIQVLQVLARYWGCNY